MKRALDPVPTVHTLAVDELRGIDLQNNASVVSPSRSPACSNLLRTTPGRVEKRPGYVQTAAYEGAVHGCYDLDGVEILHAGGALYADGVRISGSVADARSCGQCFHGRLYLLDGQQFWQISSEAGQYRLQPVSEAAYVPKIAVGKKPDGSGGAELEDVNLLSDAWSESFYGTADAVVYQLEFDGLSAAPVRVQVLRAAAAGTQLTTLTENTDFTVDRARGAVTFVKAPGVSPIEGEDNVFITAARDRSAQRARIVQSDVCCVYGEAGGGVRLFVTGSPQWKNRDYWSAANDPTYFSDLSYSVLGQDDGRIVGYSLLGDSLAAHKGGENGAVWVRTGSQETLTDAQGNTRRVLGFRTGRVLSGYGAAAKGSFAVLGNEPLFLTAQGIFALTASDLTGERYQQRRSYYIDPALTAEPAMESAEAVVWKDFYLLALNGRVYCLDGLQKAYAPQEPKSAFQYECYLLENVPAVRLWVRGGRLWFGTADGRVCVFTQGAAGTDFADRLDGLPPQPIRAVWETPDIGGAHFYRDKSFRFLAARIQPAPVTSVRLQARREGVWHALRDKPFSARYFSFSGMVFSKWTFSCDQTCQPMGLRLHSRKQDKIRFRFENDALDEPFGLLGWALEYTEGRRHKR